MIEITSHKNDKIKELIHFRSKNGRIQADLILIEGSREIERAVAAGIEPLEIYFCTDFLPKEADAALLSMLQNRFIKADYYSLKKSVFEAVAYKNNPFGILMLAKYSPRAFTAIELPQNPACLILDNIEKPGNLGALLRTADGAGLHAVYQTGNLTDFRNPNVIRASTGAIFNLNYSLCAAEELIKHLKAKHIPLVAADPYGDLNYSEVNYHPGFALVVGAEDKGLSEIYRQNADYLVKIPMLGAADSLNVYQAATVILFEALRQRNFQN